MTEYVNPVHINQGIGVCVSNEYGKSTTRMRVLLVFGNCMRYKQPVYIRYDSRS